MTRALILLVASVLPGLAVTPAAAFPLSFAEESGRAVAAELSPRVVRIAGVRSGGRTSLPSAGVLLADGDLVITVTLRAGSGSRTVVSLPGGEDRVGVVVARDSGTGGTLIRLESGAGVSGIPVSGTVPRAGDPAITAGYPFGPPGARLTPAIGLAVVAQIRRDGPEKEISDYLITEVVNPGDVGGPVVDRHGHLLALLSFRGDPLTGLARAIPVERIRRALKDLPEAAALAPAPAPASVAEGDWPVHDALRDAVTRVHPAVFSLLVTREKDGFSGREIGTAFFVTNEGHAVTMSENVADAKSIEAVLHDGRRLKVKRLGEDERHGLVLLSVEGENLPAKAVLRSDAPRVGTFVVAVGRPDGEDWQNGPLVSVGIVGARNRNDRRWGALHTDAGVNRGNVGGPLLNLEGEVVGILSTLDGSTLTGLGANSGLGFAIPAAVLAEHLPALMKGEFLAYRPGQLGVRLDIAYSGGGVKVISVEPGKAAALAGMKAEDIILAVNGKPIDGLDDMRRIFVNLLAGDEVELLLHRGEETLTVTPTLGQWAVPPR
jgi:S1-C subfamily serine protease